MVQGIGQKPPAPCFQGSNGKAHSGANSWEEPDVTPKLQCPAPNVGVHTWFAPLFYWHRVHRGFQLPGAGSCQGCVSEGIKATEEKPLWATDECSFICSKIKRRLLQQSKEVCPQQPVQLACGEEMCLPTRKSQHKLLRAPIAVSCGRRAAPCHSAAPAAAWHPPPRAGAHHGCSSAATQAGNRQHGD